MAASYPKPDGQKQNRNKPVFDWSELPLYNEAPAPELPRWRKWHPQTQMWWKALWTKPQSVMWEPTGSTLWTLACLYDDLITGIAETSKVSSEMRQHEDRHGLNPKAMLQLRWKVQNAVEEKREQTAQDLAEGLIERRKRLKIVG